MTVIKTYDKIIYLFIKKEQDLILQKTKKTFIQVFVTIVSAVGLFFAFSAASNNQVNVQAASWQKVAESGLSKQDISARRWISFHESTNRYHARNGVCYGKFQLSISYLHGDYSKKNQELTANRYVASRYGSWTNAKSFWQAHHWY